MDSHPWLSFCWWRFRLLRHGLCQLIVSINCHRWIWRRLPHRRLGAHCNVQKWLVSFFQQGHQVQWINYTLIVAVDIGEGMAVSTELLYVDQRARKSSASVFRHPSKTTIKAYSLHITIRMASLQLNVALIFLVCQLWCVTNGSSYISKSMFKSL